MRRLAERPEELRGVRPRLYRAEERDGRCHVQRRPVLRSPVVVRRRLDALLGKRKRRMRDGHEQGQHVRRLLDGLSGHSAAVFRLWQQLRVRLRLHFAGVDALRIDLRRYHQQPELLRGLQHSVHGRHDLPAGSVQMPERHGRLCRHLRDSWTAEWLRQQRSLRSGVSGALGGQRFRRVQRDDVRHSLLRRHSRAVRHLVPSGVHAERVRRSLQQCLPSADWDNRVLQRFYVHPFVHHGGVRNVRGQHRVHQFADRRKQLWRMRQRLRWGDVQWRHVSAREQ